MQKFCQIKIVPEDEEFQQFLGKDNFSDGISEYRHITVTYGSALIIYINTKIL